jgi:hypothetical protein
VKPNTPRDKIEPILQCDRCGWSGVGHCNRKVCRVCWTRPLRIVRPSTQAERETGYKR